MISTAPLQIVVPDTGLLMALAEKGALESLLVFGEDVRIVLTDYVVVKAARSQQDTPEAKAIDDFIRDNACRIEIEKTAAGEAYETALLMNQKLGDHPSLAAQAGIFIKPVPDLGEMMVALYVRGLADRPREVPVLILADDAYFLSEVTPVPGNAHVVSTSSFLRTISRLATASVKLEPGNLLAEFREGSDAAEQIHLAPDVSRALHRLADYAVLSELARERTQATRLDGRACLAIYKDAEHRINWQSMTERERTFADALGLIKKNPET